MTWVKIDDSFTEHPKVVTAGPLALVVQIRAICYCARHLTDGLLPPQVVRQITRDLRSKKPWGFVMVKAGLWEKTGDGYRVHDYLHYNPTRAEVLQSREKWADRARKAATSRWANRDARPMLPSTALASRKHVDSHAPVPVPVSKEQELTPLPPLPPDDTPPDQDLCQLCVQALRHLNDRTGRAYPGSDRVMAMLHGRHLAHGVEKVVGVIDSKVEEWLHDPDMHRHLAPETLFGPKFAKYVNALIVPPAPQRAPTESVEDFEAINRKADATPLAEAQERMKAGQGTRIDAIVIERERERKRIEQRRAEFEQQHPKPPQETP